MSSSPLILRVFFGKALDFFEAGASSLSFPSGRPRFFGAGLLGLADPLALASSAFLAS